MTPQPPQNNALPPRALLPKIEPGNSSQSPPLDSIPDGEPAPKRRCVSNACEPCRTRKSKCDGVKPKCIACMSVYDTECSYDPDNDRRRKGALRKEIRELKAQKEEQNTILDAIRTGSEADVDDIIQLIRTNPDEPYESIADSVKKMCLTSPKKSDIPTLERELAEFGKSTDKAGETRHYGHTSNLTLVGSEEEKPVIAGDQVGSWTTATTDGELVKHLLSLYFAWSHPFYMLFPEEVFWYGLNNKKSKYCSPMLVNAVLALACNYSDQPGARQDPDDPTTVGNHFFAEAKRLLAEDDRSCLTTVQALGVMSIRQAMNNHDSNGWSFSGRMMAMSVELGLHMTYNQQPGGKVTPTEIEVRKITFWGCYVLETAWAICVGRISALPRTAIRLDKPILRENLEIKVWKPYGDPRDKQQTCFLEQQSFTYNLLLQSSLLSEIVNDTVQMFYAPRDRITSRKLQQHHDRFQQWHKNLPSVLAIKQKEPTLPQVLTLHIYYHNCVNHLFRPFVRVTFKDGTKQGTKSPRQICTESAITISQLLKTYSTTYGLRRGYFIMTHCCMSAAIIHLLNISNQNPNPVMTIQAGEYLLEAIGMLQEMLTAFPIVARYLKVIRSLAEKWEADLPLNVRDTLKADFPSPASSNSNPVISPQQISPAIVSPADTSRTVENRKDSAPELLQMPQRSTDNLGLSTPGSQQFLWTPFPECMDGMPVDPPKLPTSNMDISSMLASESGAEWGQLGKDGFVMDDADFTAPLWGVNWDQQDGSVTL